MKLFNRFVWLATVVGEGVENAAWIDLHAGDAWKIVGDVADLLGIFARRIHEHAPEDVSDIKILRAGRGPVRKCWGRRCAGRRRHPNLGASG